MGTKTETQFLEEERFELTACLTNCGLTHSGGSVVKSAKNDS